jgi:hypothetical protein
VSEAFVVKKTYYLYATGHGLTCGCPVGCWTKDHDRAFLFEDQISNTGPFRGGRDWAEAHADDLRRQSPKEERKHIHVVSLPERGKEGS